MSGLDQVSSGELEIEGRTLSNYSQKELAKYRGNIGMVFQSYNLLPNLNAMENILVGSWAGGGNSTEEDAKKVMEKLHLGHRLKADVKTLSGGEKQRVAICRSLMGDPQILFCDEPTGALDTENEKEVIQILHNLNKEGLTIVMVTHNPEFKQYADKVVELSDGLVVKN